MSLSPRSALCLLACCCATLITGCSIAPTPTEPIIKATTAQGHVRGGQQPVSGSTIQLFAVGTTGDGSASTGLLTQAVTTDAGGNFTISGLYTCPSASALVYLTATGGDPGLGSGLSNPNLVLMAAIGRCDSLTRATFLLVDEATTVAAVSPLAPFMTSATAVGSSSSDLADLQAAFTMASYFANTTTGTSPGLNVPAGDTVPVATINTLADVLSACVNSTGGKAGDGSLCGQLFTFTTYPPSVVPTDTVAALIAIAFDPALNTTALYNLAPSTPPYQPMLPAAPSNFAVHLILPSLLQITPAGGLTLESTPANPAPTQTATITNNGGSSVGFTGLFFSGADAADYSQTNNCPVTLPPAGQCLVTVTFTPSMPNMSTASLVVTSSDPNSPQSIPVTGTTTLTVSLAISPTRLTFPDTSVGFTSPSQTINVQNTGSLPADLSSGVGGTNGYDFEPNSSSSCPAVLMVGASCKVTVAATPQALGTRNGSYIFTSDAPNSPQSVPLTVTGIAPNNGPAKLSTTSLSWTIEGLAQDVLLENLGNTPLTVGAIGVTNDQTYDTANFSSTTNCELSLPPQSVCTITVTSTGLASDNNMQPIPYTGTLNVPVDIPAGTLTAQLSSANSIGVSGPVIGFGSAVVGTTVAGGFSVSPSSHNTTGGFGGTLTGPAATDFSPASPGCSIDLFTHPAVPCTAIVNFTPSTTGIRTARINSSSGYLAFIGLGVSSIPTGPTGPLFYVSPSPLRIPLSTTNAPASAALTITNNSAATQKFTSFPVTGMNSFLFTAVDSSGACANLAPTASCSVTVSYTGDPNTEASATVTIADSVSGTSQMVPVTNTDNFPVAAPSLLQFPEQTVGTTSAPMSFTVSGANGQPYPHNLAISVMESGSPFSILSGSRCLADSSQACTTSVVFTPQVNNTSAYGNISILDTVTGQTGNVSLNGYGIGIPNVTLSQSSIAFPQRPVNSTSLPTMITLQNNGTYELQFKSITLAGANPGDFAETNTCTYNLGIGQSCTITISYAPVETGSQSAVVQIITNAPTSPDTITLTGTAD